MRGVSRDRGNLDWWCMGVKEVGAGGGEAGSAKVLETSEGAT